jgi:serine/threonine protein kinase/tetratricopeptide (TPR) repeat protein
VDSAISPELLAALSDRYLIERQIGRGGMATVYLAEDRKHQRMVAIKVLHPELAVAVGPLRFRREITIAAQLQHPHVLPLLDSGAGAGVLWFAMPYVDGESLRQRLARERQLPLADALRITTEIASALEHAHQRGVIHRDVKPENILLAADGHALLADFGVARDSINFAEGTGERWTTDTGVSIGTLEYMSPEQTNGQRDLDARSDVYSLGCVLYEMLAGEPPFTGPTAQAIISKRFTEPVPSVRAARPTTPETIDRAVAKALAQIPADRFTTAAQFAQALSLPTTTTSATTPKSIAVLPFVNMSADPENEYFTDGIAEEIINALTKIQSLRVASRTSSFAFKGKATTIADIGATLKAATILEGSVRKSGNRLRVTAQLIDVRDGYHLWSERYDRQLEDVFAIQDEIADSIVGALRVVLSDDEKRAIGGAATTDVRAYDFYLRGRQYFHQFRRAGIQFARRMFERALEIDPRYALASAAAADCCSFLYMYWDASKANLDAADTFSRQALEFGPDLAEAHASRGFALSLSKRHDEARREFETAIRIDPQLYEAHYFYARASMQEGTIEEAVRQYETAARVRPDDFQALFLMSSALHSLNRAADADAALRLGVQRAESHLELNPDDARAWYLGAGAVVQLGDPERGVEWAQRALAIDPDDPGVLYNVACTYANLGRIDDAVTCLEQAIENGFGHREWLDHDSDLDPLHGNPRFEALRARL